MLPSKFIWSLGSEPDPDPIHADRGAVRAAGHLPPGSDARRRTLAFDRSVGGLRPLGRAPSSDGRAPANGSVPLATIAVIPGAARPATRARVRSGIAGRRAIPRAHCDLRASGRVAHARNAAAPRANERRACGADSARVLDMSGPVRRGPAKDEAAVPWPTRLDAGAKVEAVAGEHPEPRRHRPRGTPAVRWASREATVGTRVRAKPRRHSSPRNSGRRCRRHGYRATKPAGYACAVLIRFDFLGRTLVLTSGSLTTSTTDSDILTLPTQTNRYKETTRCPASLPINRKRATSRVGISPRYAGCQSRLPRRESHRRRR